MDRVDRNIDSSQTNEMPLLPLNNGNAGQYEEAKHKNTYRNELLGACEHIIFV